MVISSVCSGHNTGHGSGCPNHSEALTGNSASTRRIEPTCEVVRAARPPDSNFFELLARNKLGVSQQILTGRRDEKP